MHGARRLAVILAVLTVPTGAFAAHRGGPKPSSCPTEPAAVLAEQCPCDGAMRHGQYVTCVVRVAKALRKAGCPREVLAGMVRCAARSTCGRPTAVVCCTTARVRIARDEATCTAAGGSSAGPGTVCGACNGPASTTSSTSSTTSTTSTTSSTTSTTLAAAVSYGNYVEFPGASTHAPGYLLGSPITIPAPSVLTHLCVIAKAGGANVILSLYSDKAGWPDRLVAATPATPTTAGPMEIPVAGAALGAGTYWIMGVYDTEASVGLDETDPLAPVRYKSHAFGSPLSDPFGPAAPYSGQKFNYYVMVE